MQVIPHIIEESKENYQYSRLSPQKIASERNIINLKNCPKKKVTSSMSLLNKVKSKNNHFQLIESKIVISDTASLAIEADQESVKEDVDAQDFMVNLVDELNTINEACQLGQTQLGSLKNQL